MCGICGKLNFNEADIVDSELIHSMTDTLIHRGPDDDGYFIKDNIGLGFRRLSIIDLDTGQQPVFNEDQSIAVVFNGEIYNFREIGQQLKVRHKFISKGDSEVIVHAYEEYGIDFVKKLNGIFAIAIWDSNLKNLLLIRDRLGVKPLFYAINKDSVIFGSEIKSILEDKTIDNEIDVKGLSDYLQFYYNPDPRTIYKKIKSLSPASFVIINEKGNWYEKKYWNIEINNSINKDMLELLDNEVNLAVKRQLVSDVPVGLFLSGGIDSSVLCAVYSKYYNKDLLTFSAGFREDTYSELGYANEVAEKFRTIHNKIEIYDTVDILDKLEKILLQFDMPFGDPSVVPFYYISRLAQDNNIKVVLSGDGADEILGGYETYQADILMKYLQYIPNSIKKKLLRPLINLLPVSDKKISLDYKLKRLIEYSTLPPFLAHCSWRTIFNNSEKERLLNPGLYNDIKNYKPLGSYFKEQACVKDRDIINQGMYVDTKIYLPADMLIKVDRMSMMNSLEVRVPYLDHNLVEYAFSLSSKLKVSITKTKILLKQLALKWYPKSFVNRKKQGFNIPVGIWLNNFLKDFMYSHLFTKKIKESGLFNMDYIRGIIKKHKDRERDFGYELWTLLSFCVWYNNK